MSRYIKSIFRRLYFLFNERTYNKRLKYVYKNMHSKTLIISFSGFSAKPVYNYMRTLQSVKADQLYLLDNFGSKGSYYWFENGENAPMKLVQGLIDKIILQGKYDRIVTLGTNKGGTCALYYGLQISATDIYAGACQYYVGAYLNTAKHLPILQAMMGKYSVEEAQNIVDRMLPDVIRQFSGSKSHIHLLYSKKEHTYDEHIKYLIDDLKAYNMKFDEHIECFEEHNDVGVYFSHWLLKNLKK